MLKRKILILLINLLFSVIILGMFILIAWGISTLRIILKPEYKATELMMRSLSILVASLGAITIVFFWLAQFYRFIRYLMVAKSSCLSEVDLETFKKPEKWAVALGWWIPRKYRGPIVGDILEDCHEMRDKSCGELRIRIQVLWQWAIAVATLIPVAIFGSIWRRLNPPK
jgi:hypothetical protein